MSADLLDLDDFFGPPPASTVPPKTSQGHAPFPTSSQTLNAAPSQQTISQPTLFDLDGFGTLQSSSFTSSGPPTTQAGTSPWPSIPSLPAIGPRNATTMLSAPPLVSHPANTTENAAEEEDDAWGDFEVAEPTNLPTSLPAAAAPQSAAWAQPPIQALYTQQQNRPNVETTVRPRERVIRASTMDLLSNNLIDLGFAPTPTPGAIPTPKPKSKATPPLEQPRAKDPNVLFDVDDFSIDSHAETFGGFQGDSLDDDDDGDFGDFESAAQSNAPMNPAPPAARSAALDLLFLDDRPPPPQHKSSSHGVGHSLTHNTPSNIENSPSPYPQPPTPTTFRQRNPFPGLALTTSKKDEVTHSDAPGTPSPATAWPSFDDNSAKPTDEEWPPFEDLDTKSKSTTQKPTSQRAKESVRPQVVPKPAPTANEDDWGWDSFDEPTVPAAGSSGPAPAAAYADRDDEPPPTNIPPPSVLLSIFPSLLSLANTSLTQPISGKSASIKARVMEDPATLEFLKGFLLIATVAARVIAGRKLRWHRDQFLSKSMTISAAGSKGMKLAGVDKTQSNREDREASDIVVIWKENVGRLRSAVAAANASQPDKQQFRIPELSETLSVQTAKVVPTAPRPCVICGLKREERLAKVDFDVEDSFGEWWIEHWGHRACRNFWRKHEKALRQR